MIECDDEVIETIRGDFKTQECSLATTCCRLAVGGGGNSTAILWYSLQIDLAPDFISVALPIAKLHGCSLDRTLLCRGF